MNRQAKEGMAAGIAAAEVANARANADTRKLLHDLGEHLRYERSAAEAELTGPVHGPQVARGMFDAVKRHDKLCTRIAALGALIKRIEFALADVQ